MFCAALFCVYCDHYTQNRILNNIRKTSPQSYKTQIKILPYPALEFRIDFKSLIITFKAIYGHAPEYICNLTHIKNSSTYGLRSNSKLLLAPPSTKTKKTLGFCL